VLCKARCARGARDERARVKTRVRGKSATSAVQAEKMRACAPQIWRMRAVNAVVVAVQ